MKTVHRQIFGLAWPAIATNITTPLLSLIDVAIVGHMDNAVLIGAVAVGGTVFNILYWLFAFLRMGTSGVTAQAYGASDSAAQKKAFIRGCIIALGGGAFILLVAPLCGQKIIALVDGGGTVTDEAWTYFRVAIIGAPGVLMSYVVSGWLLGMQRSKPIMWIALTTNVLNILSSLIFVYVFDFGIIGVGLGTAVAQLIGATIGTSVVIRSLRGLDKDEADKTENGRPGGLWDKKVWKSLFRINSDIFLRTLCLASVTLWFTHAGARLGSDILTANSLLLQLFLVFSYFMDGFAFGGEALAGRYYGANDVLNLKKTVNALFKWGIYTSLVFTALYFFAGELFLDFLTDDLHVLGVVRDFSLWAVIIPLSGFTAFTWDGVFIGLTKTRYLLTSMLVSMVVFYGVYAIGYFVMADYSGLNHLLWLAFILYLASRGVTSTILYRRFLKDLLR